MVSGQLVDVSRHLLAMCVETGDVWQFGREVSVYENGMITSRDGSWLAGVNAAQPGLLMPGTFAVGARYTQGTRRGGIIESAVNSGKNVTVTVRAGTFNGCVTVTEYNSSQPGAKPVTKTYAPGIGLVRAGDALELATVIHPQTSIGKPVLGIQEAIQFTWPLSSTNFLLESSINLTNWTLVPQSTLLMDGQNKLSVPKDATKKFFRLTSP